MPINLPPRLPAIAALERDNIFTMDAARAHSQDIRPLRIVVLNLMPLKITTETDIARILSNSPLQVELNFMKLRTHKPRHTAAEHLDAFYRDIKSIRKEKWDGMIVTGAPVENLAFEDVTYWKEIKEIFSWAREYVTSTFYICWAAQAGLYYHYGINKHALSEKLFGVFSHRVHTPHHPLLRGFDDCFEMPHSRYTTLHAADIEKVPDLEVLASSDDAGVCIIASRDGREVFVTGHSEYAPNTLDTEYKRDRDKGLSTALPKHYYPNDDTAAAPIVQWRAHGNLLFGNWLNYCVYQQTPYNLD